MTFSALLYVVSWIMAFAIFVMWELGLENEAYYYGKLALAFMSGGLLANLAVS